MRRSVMLICPYFRLRYYDVSKDEEQLFCRCELINHVLLDQYYFKKYRSVELNRCKKKIMRHCLEYCPHI